MTDDELTGGVTSQGEGGKSTGGKPAERIAETMPLVRCPHCRHRFTINDADSSEEMHCLSCGELFHLLRDSVSDIPKRVGRFELIQPLGMGSFGAVFHGRDTELDRSVAVKIPRQQNIEESEIDEIMHEARVAAQLRHNNIVSIHEVGRDGDYIYIVSDLIDGLPLNRWLDEQPADMRQQVEICRRLALALDHAHESGIVHRDLKPANILIDHHNEPHLTDFGLAKQSVDDVTMTMDGQILGTPAYMSPEQAKGNAHSCDRRSDVYSMGVILFEMLTGDLPFRGNIRALAQKVIHEDPPSPRQLNPHVSVDLETLCLKCLRKDPRQRYATARNLAEDLQNWLDDFPVTARPIGPIERLWRWSLRRPVAMGMTAALLLTVGLLAVASIAILGSSTRRVGTILAPVEAATQVLIAEKLSPRVAQAAEQLRVQPELFAPDQQQALTTFLQTQFVEASNDAQLVDHGIDIDSWFVLNSQAELTAIYPHAQHVVGQRFPERNYFSDVIGNEHAGPHIAEVYKSQNTHLMKLPVSMLVTTELDGSAQKHVLVASVSAPGTKVIDLIRSLRSQISTWMLIACIPMGVFLVALVFKGSAKTLRRLN